jgi:hypothetical protein
MKMYAEAELYLSRKDPDYYVGMSAPEIHDVQGGPVGWQSFDEARWDDGGAVR